MALSVKKPQPAPAAVSPHVQALRDHQQAILDTRAKLNALHERDRLAAADIAQAEASAARVRAIQEEIDQRRGEATYSGAQPPDTRRTEKQLHEAQLYDRGAQNVARAAQVVRTKFADDIRKLNDANNARAKENPRFLWVALREDVLAGLAEEYLAAEAAFLEIRKRAFGAALAADTIAMSQAYGEFSGSALGADFNIPRPDHPAYRPVVLTPEQSYAERRAYAASIAAAAKQFMDDLLNP